MHIIMVSTLIKGLLDIYAHASVQLPAKYKGEQCKEEYIWSEIGTGQMY